MRHPANEHFVFLVDIIDDVVDSIDIFIDLFSNFSNFYDFDLGPFDSTYNDSNESAIVCSICVEISSAIHSDYDAGASSDPSISLPPFSHLPWS